MVIKNCSDKIACQFLHAPNYCSYLRKEVDRPCENHPLIKAWDRQKAWGFKEATPMLNHRTTLEAIDD